MSTRCHPGRLTVLLLAILCAAARAEPPAPRYVFLLIGDGLGEYQAEAAERALAAAPGDKLLFRTFPVRGLQRTQTADAAAITDSAAAVTAMACGVRTLNGKLAMTVDDVKLTSIAYLAHRAGRQVGILSDMGIDHATPAGFYAQTSRRDDYADIAAQMARCPFHFLGGSAMIGEIPGGQRVTNNQELALASGFTLVNTREALRQPPAGTRIFAHTRRAPDAPATPPPAIEHSTNDIRLAEYTAAAIRHLQGTPFFIMIEGGQIDLVCHANDLGAMVREVERFDEAVRVCFDFAQAHPGETLIVVTGDHETGGLTPLPDRIGADPRRLLGQRMAGISIVAACRPLLDGQAPFAEVAAQLDLCFGDKAFDAESLRQIETFWAAALASTDKAGKRVLDFVVRTGRLFVEQAGYAFTTTGHTADDVPVYAFGAGAETFSGHYDNTAIFDKLKALMISTEPPPAAATIEH